MLFHQFGALLLSPRSKTVVSNLSSSFKLFDTRCLLNLRLAFLVCLLACSPFFVFLFTLTYSERAPTILFCFNRIHNKIFCCSKIWRRVATELVKKMKPVFFRACANFVRAFFNLCAGTFSPVCSWERAYIATYEPSALCLVILVPRPKIVDDSLAAG